RGTAGLELLGGVGAQLGARLAPPPAAVVPTAAVAIAGAVAVAGVVVLGPFGLPARARVLALAPGCALALLGSAPASQGWAGLVDASIPGVRQAISAPVRVATVGSAAVRVEALDALPVPDRWREGASPSAAAWSAQR